MVLEMLRVKKGNEKRRKGDLRTSQKINSEQAAGSGEEA
jgi:hypothetical protein